MKANGLIELAVRHSAVVVAFAAWLAGMGFATTAHAGIGETADSVPRDHAALRGISLTVTPMAAYDIHEITTADSRVREYVSRSGTVFAVAWSGRARPDLSVVLGTRYASYANAPAAPRGSHKVLALTADDLVLHVTKLPRSFVGEAHAPTLLPAGVSAQDIR